MKKILLCGLFVLLLIYVMPVGAYTAVNDAASVYNSPYMGDCIDIFSNDILPNTFTDYEITQEPNHGYVIMAPWCSGVIDGLLYTSDHTAYFGPDIFKYRVYNGHSWSNVATVYLNVVPYGNCNFRTWLYTHMDTELSVNSNEYLGCDNSFFGGAPLSAPVSGTSHGTITPKVCQWGYNINEGCFDYTPNAGFRGWDTFTFRPWWDTGNWGDVPGKEIEVMIYVGQEPYPTPEFPSAFLPATMIIGFLGAVLLIQRTKEH